MLKTFGGEVYFALVFLVLMVTNLFEYSVQGRQVRLNSHRLAGF